jgi:hypothetical protein
MICIFAMVMSLLISDPPRSKPAAMVLDLKGSVQLRSTGGEARPAKVCDLLYAGERLAVPADGAATVAILGFGAQERLAPGSEATVGPDGCTPATAVIERREQRPAVARTMKGVRPAPGDGRKAAMALRSSGDEPQAITPIQGATIAADRPGFDWPPAKDAKSYQVKLLSGDGREFWRTEAKEPKLEYPGGREALKRGNFYRWEVTDQESRPLVSGQFMVATESELKQLDELKPLAAGGDRADLLTAALAYRRLGCYAEAIAAFERLTKLAPGEGVYRDELSRLSRQAGRPEDLIKGVRGAAAKHE